MGVNKEKTIAILHKFIDSLDDDGIYDLIEDIQLEGEGVFTCGKCEEKYGACDDSENIMCKERFGKWMNE